jgi:3-hydroxyacyl-CoA dehydrogenase/3-hydroxy-2-methylbutyryl-CoA dehydrogenase
MATLARTVALVSGGASGLGAATARHLIQQGARVMVADLNMTSERVQPLRDWAVSQNIRLLDESDTLSSCYAQGPCLAFCPTNVTKSDEVNHALNQLERVFGEPLNAAVSCAGIAIAQKTLSKKGPHDLDDFIETMMVNTVGSFNVSRLAAARMQEREPDRDGLRGCIVNTASIAAFEGQIGQVAYSASKGGIVGMTLPMARELSRYGIRVMTIAPGLFETPLLSRLPESAREELGNSVPCPRRLGNPDEFGALVGTVLSNPMLNGSVIRLDGALRMPP